MAGAQQTLLRLANGDEPAAETRLDLRASARLDDKTAALVQICALVASGAPCASYGSAVPLALACGASVDEVLAALVAISATVGSARVVLAIPGISLGLGYDVDAALQACPATWS